MPRYIDADAFIKEQCNSCDGYCEKVDCDCLNCDSDCRCDMIKDLQDAPTISPDEVRGVGEWKMWEDYYGSNVYQCSVCEADWDMIDGTPEDNDMNYCPHCGAKMEEA